MLNISFSTARKAFWILLVPILELLTLRIYLHSYLGLRFGFVRTTDFDFILPAPLAFLILVHALEQNQNHRFNFQKVAAAINTSAIAGFLAINHFYQALSLISPAGVVSIWFLSLAITLVSAFCLLVPPAYYLKNSNRFAFLPCVLIATSMYFYMNGFHQLWNGFGALTSTIIHEIFTVVRFANVTSVFTPEDAVKINHPLLSVRISQGCGGLDSFFFFSLVFLVVGSLHGKNLRAFKWLQIYLGGIALMYAANIFRIIFLFFSGIALREILGMKLGTEIFVSLFHMHFGWLLYGAVMYSYLKAWNGKVTGRSFASVGYGRSEGGAFFQRALLTFLKIPKLNNATINAEKK